MSERGGPPREWPREWKFYIDDMIAFADRAQTYVQGMTLFEFIADDRTYDATLRNLTLIGEAAGRIPESIRARHPGVPWRLGSVAVSYGPALRSKIVSAKARGAGRSHSAVKSRNAGWRDFGPQPEGTATIFPQYGVAARSCSSATRRSLRLVLQKNSRRRGAV